MGEVSFCDRSNPSEPITPVDVRLAQCTAEERWIVTHGVERMRNATVLDRAGRNARAPNLEYEDTAAHYLDQTVGYESPEQIRRWHNLASLIIDMRVLEEREQEEYEIRYCQHCHSPIERGTDTRGRPQDLRYYVRAKFCSHSCRCMAYQIADHSTHGSAPCRECGRDFNKDRHGQTRCPDCRA